MAQEKLFPNEIEIEQILKSGAQRKCLDFSGYGVNSEMALFISDCISSSRLNEFEHVNISGCQIPLSGFNALVNSVIDSRELISFDASNNDLSRDAGFAVAKLLGARGKLKKLVLSDNKFGDVGIASIAGTFTSDLGDLDSNSFISMLSLTELDLSGTNCGDMGALALCRGLTQFSRHTTALGRFPRLKSLNLSRNHIGDKGALCLSQLLFTCASIRNALVSTNTTLDESSGFQNETGTFGASTLQLENLNLSDNLIGPRGLVSFFESHDNLTYIPVKSLAFSRCKISIAVLESISTHLVSTFSQLERVDLDIPVAIANQIIAEQVELAKESNSHKWTVIFRKLAETIASINNRQFILNIGALPELLRDQCVRSRENGDTERYYDLVGAIDAMSSIRGSLNLSNEFMSLVSSLWLGQMTSISPVETFPAGVMNSSNRALFSSPPEKDIRTVALTPSQKMEIQQVELSRLRHEHSNAFQSLASEIQRLVTPDIAQSTASVSKEVPAQRIIPVQPLNQNQQAEARSEKGARQIDGMTISGLIQATVAAAVENAKRQWERTLLAEQAEIADKNSVLLAKIDVLQERLSSLEAQTMTVDVQTRFSQLEQRIVKLEAAILAVSFREHEIQHATQSGGANRTPVQQWSDAENALSERLSMLELAVEQEHESSLQVLDALLQQQRQFKQMQLLSSGPSGPNLHIPYQNQYVRQTERETGSTDEVGDGKSKFKHRSDSRRSDTSNHSRDWGERALTPLGSERSATKSTEKALRKSDSPYFKRAVKYN